MSGIAVNMIGRLVLVKRGDRWENGTVRGISLDGTHVAVQFADEEVGRFPAHEVFFQTQVNEK